MDGGKDNPFQGAKKGWTDSDYGYETTSNLTQLSPETQHHLRNVYQNLTVTTLFAAIACYLTISGRWFEPGALSLIMFLGCLLTTMFMSNTPRNTLIRRGALYGMGFAQGWMISPLVNGVFMINPNTILMTIAATFLIFGSFTMSAYYSPRRQYLYLGGILGTILSIMMLASLLNSFMGYAWLDNVELYVGLMVFSFYVLYDTQIIVERAEGGNRDDTMHAVMLFSDLAAIFIRMLIILSRNNENNNNNNGGRRRGGRK